MRDRADRAALTRELFAWALVCAPVLALAAKALAWLRYGIDLPFFDDWRAYDQGRAGSLEPGYLFAAENGTCYPVGKALNALAQRHLDGNSVAYQLLSMLSVLGALLLLQWRLLSLALRDRLLAASAFSFTVFMLQPGTYWGRQNMAYHQALPLVFLLGALLLIIGSPWSRRWSPPAVAALGLLAGLSYISGAFTSVAAAAALLAFAPLVNRDDRRPLREGGAALLAAGVFASALQVRALVGLQGRELASATGGSPALPTEGGFWFYLLGKIARAASLQGLPREGALAATLLLAAAVLAVLGLLLRGVLRDRTRPLAEARLAVSFLFLAAVLAVYLGLIAAARAGGGGSGDLPPLTMFRKGFARFHFFWVTLLWPWLAAALLHFANKAGPAARASRAAGLALVLPLAVAPAAAAAGVFDYFDTGRAFALQRATDHVACLREALAGSGPVRCPTLYRGDLERAYRNGLAIGASFTRLFPPPPGDQDGPPPLFRLSTAEAGSWRTGNVDRVERSPDGFRMEASAQPGIFFTVDPAAGLEACQSLAVRVQVQVAEEGYFLLSYRRAGRERPSRQVSARVPFPGGQRDGVREAVIRVSSRSGFDNELSLEPVTGARSFTIRELELRCGRAARDAGADPEPSDD